MRRYIIIIAGIIICALTAACSTSTSDRVEKTEELMHAPDTEPVPDAEQVELQTEQPAVGDMAEEGSHTLVVYFSNTGNTKAAAEMISGYTDADLFEIEASVPYTEDDLNYGDDDSRTSREQNDDTARPEIANTLDNAGDYDIVFLGYPIWWGQVPKIMYTFMEQYDFSGAVIIPFCTSGSSGIGTSAANLQQVVDGGSQWLDGQRFGSGASEEEIQSWIDGLGLNF